MSYELKKLVAVRHVVVKIKCLTQGRSSGSLPISSADESEWRSCRRVSPALSRFDVTGGDRLDRRLCRHLMTHRASIRVSSAANHPRLIVHRGGERLWIDKTSCCPRRKC